MQLPSASRRSVIIAGGIIVLAALAAYHNSLSGPFIFDDKEAIAENATIRHFATAWSPPADTTASGRPVLNFSLAVSYALSRNAVWGYHALNLLIHILAGLTLFGVVRRTLDRASARSSARRSPPGEGGPDSANRVDQDATPVAFVISLLWTVHPLQTESVTYIIQRAESLMGLFYLLTLYCFIRGVSAEGGGPDFARCTRASTGDGARSAKMASAASPEGTPSEGCPAGPPRAQKAARRVSFLWFGLSWLGCFFGMATKEVMATAPLLVLLYDRTFLSGTFRAAWQRRRTFYLGLASSWILLAWLVASTGGNRGGSIGFGIGVTWWAYALTQFKAIATYLRLSLWPSPLIFDHGTFWATRAAEVVPEALAVVALVGGTVWAFFRSPVVGQADGLAPGRRPGLQRTSSLGFAGVCFFLILAPTSSIIPGTTQMIVEHRMYLSLAAVIAVAVAGIYSLAGRRGLAVLGGLSLPLIFLTAQRNADYRSERALWSDTLAKHPGDPAAETNLGVTLLDEGDTAAAMAQFQAALRVQPDSVLTHTDLGNALQKAGQDEEAMRQYQEALRLKPDYVPARVDLGNLLSQLGRIPEAMNQYEIVVRTKPDDAEAQIDLGMALTRTGRAPEALTHFETAVHLNPDLAPARFDLGNALRATGRIPEAIIQYEEALKLKSPYPEASMNLGNLLLQQGRTADAIARFEETLQARPGYAEAHNSLGVALGRSGRPAEAVAEYRNALRLNPNYLQAQSNLAQALRQLDRPDHEPTP